MLTLWIDATGVRNDPGMVLFIEALQETAPRYDEDIVPYKYR